jgi:hypothetical protein
MNSIWITALTGTPTGRKPWAVRRGPEFYRSRPRYGCLHGHVVKFESEAAAQRVADELNQEQPR